MDKFINGILLSAHDDSTKLLLFKTVISRTIIDQQSKLNDILDIVVNTINTKLNIKWVVVILEQLLSRQKENLLGNGIDIRYYTNMYFDEQDRIQHIYRTLVIECDQYLQEYLDIMSVLVIECKLELNLIDQSIATMVSDQICKLSITKYHSKLNNNVLFRIANLVTKVDSIVKMVPVMKKIQNPLMNIYIQYLSTLSIDLEESLYNKIVNSYMDILIVLWEDFALDRMEHTLLYMFNKINNIYMEDGNLQKGGDISPSISNILNLSPHHYIELIVPAIVNGNNVSEQHQYQTLKSILQWPITNTNSMWILETLNGLKKAKKNTLLASLTIECLPLIMKQMFMLDLMGGSFSIIERMLLGYQHSPDAFHQVIWLFPIAIDYLMTLESKLTELNKNGSSNNTDQPNYISFKTQNTVIEILKTTEKKHLMLIAFKYIGKFEVNTLAPTYLVETREIFKRFITLSWILIDHHTGYPEMYTPLLETLQRIQQTHPGQYERPTIFEAKKTLQDNAWSQLENLVYERTLIGRALPDRGGLFNLGNTCYMNSFLQCLYMTVPIRNYFLGGLDSDKMDSDAVKQVMERPSLVKYLQLLFGNLYLSVRQAISPANLLRSLSIEYQTGEQQDSFEFGRYLLDSLDSLLKLIIKKEKEKKLIQLKQQHDEIDKENGGGVPEEQKEKLKLEYNELVKKKDEPVKSTIITDMFSGKLNQNITCRTCKTISNSKEDYLELSLSIPASSTSTNGIYNNNDQAKPPTMETLVDEFFQKEQLVGKNQYHCSKCNKLEDADKVVTLLDTPPKYLILSIKRFYFNPQTKSISKLLNRVDYSQTLTIPNQYIEKQENNSNDNNKDQIESTNDNTNGVKYQLYAVIFHSGSSVNHGHYYSYAKPSISKEDDWCLFNDSNVSITDIQSFYNIPSRFQSDTPYILFYKRIDSKEEELETKNIDKSNHIAPWIFGDVNRDNQNIIKNTSNNNSNILNSFTTK